MDSVEALAEKVRQIVRDWNYSNADPRGNERARDVLAALDALLARLRGVEAAARKAVRTYYGDRPAADDAAHEELGRLLRELEERPTSIGAKLRGET